MICKVAFNCYPVQDMARAQAFYEGVLGLVPGDNFQGAWQEYDIGGTTFAVSSMIADFIPPGSQNSVAFEVSDLATFTQMLKSKGVVFSTDELTESPVCFMAFVKDPDGNTIALHQSKS